MEFDLGGGIPPLKLLAVAEFLFEAPVFSPQRLDLDILFGHVFLEVGNFPLEAMDSALQILLAVGGSFLFFLFFLFLLRGQVPALHGK